MKYAFEMGSRAMIYIPSFIKTGSGIQKLIRVVVIHRHTDRMEIT
jgi:high-affinity Fe2+/Pb2+ permease